MKRLKGIDLKRPELRVPGFLEDLFYDLRDRRLLPLVALVLVAIVAVPFLLSEGSPDEPTGTAAGAGEVVAGGPAGSDGAELAVVQATPGLRDYRKRLRRRDATDPFKQRYTAPDLTGAHLRSPEGQTSTTSTGEASGGAGGGLPGGAGPAPTEPSAPAAQGPPPEGDGGLPGNHAKQRDPELTLFAFAIDLRMVRTSTAADGSKETGDPVVRSKVLGPAPLPSEKAQVVTYMGLNPSTRQPLLLVSDQVTAVYGEGKCLSGASACQLMEVEAGMPVTFVYGPDGARYKFTVLKVEPVVTGHS